MKKLLGLFLILGVLVGFGMPALAADAAVDQKPVVREKPYLYGLGFAFKGGINDWLSFEVRVRGLAKRGSTDDGVQSWEFLPGKDAGYSGWIALEEESQGKENASKEGAMKKYALKIINPLFNAFEADILPVVDEKGNLLTDQPAKDKKEAVPVVPIGHLSLKMVRNAFEGMLTIKTEKSETSVQMPVLLRETTMLEDKLETLSINQAVPKDPR